MDYIEIVSDLCTPSVAAEVRAINLQVMSGEDKFIELLQSPTTSEGCKSAVLAYLADKMHSPTSSVASLYFEQAARLVDAHSKDTVKRIQQAATSIKVQSYPDAARNYFNALKLNHIDIRQYLSETLSPDWNFKAPEAVTWQYYLYLADMDTSGALDALAQKISKTKNGNDATNFLVSLASLRSIGAKKILEQYRGDQRTADGPDGPGATIDETVSIYIDTMNWR